MTPSRDVQRELNALLARLVDSSLEPSEAERLEQLVRGNRDRLQYMREYMQLEVLLQAEATVAEGLVLEDQVTTDLSPIHSRVKPRKSLFSRSTWLVAGLAAAVCIAVLAFRSGAPELATQHVLVTPVTSISRPPAPVATLRLQADATWKGQQWEVGHAFREGDRIELLSGDAQISVGYGAEIAVKGPSTIHFVAHDRLQLENGEVTVHVAEWAKGFTVATNSMEVVDLGTMFTVVAGNDGNDEARVLKGLVRVHPRSDSLYGDRGLLVGEGESLSVTPDGRHANQAVLPEPVADAFDLSEIVPYRPVVLYNTGLGLMVGDEDAHWVVVAGPEGTLDNPEYATVCVPDPRYLANDPELSQWVSLASWRTAKANTTYTFQTRFDLTGYDLATTRLFGRFLADNGIKSVRVNGHAVEVQSWVDNKTGQEFGSEEFRFVDITNGLVQGENIVEIDVWNGVFGAPSPGNSTPNPMALRVEWCAFGRRSDVAVTQAFRNSPICVLQNDFTF